MMVSIVIVVVSNYLFLVSSTNFFEGVTVSLPDKAPFTCRVVLVACTCDLPARAQVMNVTQFNGYYGCAFCLQKGKLYMHC